MTEGYLRDVPKDPIMGNSTVGRSSWKMRGQAVNSTEPGIFDVRSGSDKKSLDGSNYADW